MLHMEAKIRASGGHPFFDDLSTTSLREQEVLGRDGDLGKLKGGVVSGAI